MPEKLPHLPDEHHYAIANVAARASLLDHEIERVIATRLFNEPKTSEFILKNLGTDRLVGLLKAMLLDAAPLEEAEIEKLVGEINSLRGERNNVMHWIWGKSSDPDKARSFTVRPHREPQQRSWTAGEVQAIADGMKKLFIQLAGWEDRFLHELSRSLREKHGQQAPQTNSASPSGEDH